MKRVYVIAREDFCANRFHLLNVVGIEDRNVFASLDAGFERKGRVIVDSTRVLFEHAVNEDVMVRLNALHSELVKSSSLFTVFADLLQERADMILRKASPLIEAADESAPVLGGQAPILHLGLDGPNHRHANQSIGVPGRIAVEQVVKQIRGFRIDEGRSAERQLIRSFGRSRRHLINRNKDAVTNVTDDFSADEKKKRRPEDRRSRTTPLSRGN